MRSTHLTGSSELEREADDFYKTPAWATRALLDREEFRGVTWEPACGDGAISELLPGEVWSTDLVFRGYGEGGVNFLEIKRASVNNVVTNPPYNLAQKFVEHSLEVSTHKVAMLLKLNFLASQGRKEFFENTPLKIVWVFSKRLSFDRGNTPNKGNGVLEYAWFVWDKSWKQRPQIQWI